MNSKVDGIKPSATIEISTQVRELRRKGIDIISLNIGEPDFAPPQAAVDGVLYALEHHISQYGAVPGFIELREKICEKLVENNLRYTPDEICVSTGAKQAVFNALMAVCEPGDEVLLPTPCWVSYDAMVRLCDAIPVPIELKLKNGFQLDIDALAERVTEKTKAIIINSPNNPTGAVYSKESLEKLVELAVRHDFWIISDEIYEKIIYDDNVHVSVGSLSEEARNHTITVNGFSKAYAIPGWRVGYSAAPKALAKTISKVQGHMTSAATSIAQYGAYYALMYGQESVQKMSEEYSARKKLISELLKNIPDVSFLEPQGTFYVFLDVQKYFNKLAGEERIANAIDLAKYVLNRAHVAIVPGEAFSMSGFERISFSNSRENIVQAITAMKKALSELK